MAKPCSGFEQNLSILSGAEKQIGEFLLELGQHHLMVNWPAPGTNDADKKRLLAQIALLEKQMAPAGLKGYVQRAQVLLEESRTGVNPYDGFIPKVPSGARLATNDATEQKKFDEMEALGMKEVGQATFVLVAGGLGERLGYSGIKVALPLEITTNTCYLSAYCQHILALQQNARDAGQKDCVIPFVIMTSGDTDAKTRDLLAKNKNFGMAEGQLTIVKQELVPALLNNAAHFAIEGKDAYCVSTKPHGHGDVHTLLFQSGLTDAWSKAGKKWVCFFQDTNGLVFRAFPAAIGVSANQKLAVNSLTVPRRPGEAVGAICKLEGKTNSMTINVEYNQLDALMKASGTEDKCDDSGFSPYPGNINVLVFDCSLYAQELENSKGIISEFVNPKYADGAKTTFKAPTRLECMMQDYPKLLHSSVTVGCTQFERWTCFSAVKNNISDAIGKQVTTGFAESGATGEADVYWANRNILAMCGANIDVEGKEQTYSKIKVKEGARVVLSPSFACTQQEAKAKIGVNVTVSGTSSLVVNGKGIKLSSLTLDGALEIHCADGATVSVSGTVSNQGYSFVPTDGKTVSEEFMIRGYTLEKKEAVVVRVSSGSETVSLDGVAPGNYNLSGGKLEKC